MGDGEDDGKVVEADDGEDEDDCDESYDEWQCSIEYCIETCT